MKYRKIAVMIMSMALMGATGVAAQAAETENAANEQDVETEDAAKKQVVETENSEEEQTTETKSSATDETKSDSSIQEEKTKSSAKDKKQETGTDTAQKKENEAFPDKVAVQIMLEGTSARAGSESVQIDGATVTITEGGTYMLSGSLSDGQIVVDAGDTAKVSLILNGVRIMTDGRECIAVKSADEVLVTLSEGSANILSDGSAAQGPGNPGSRSADVPDRTGSVNRENYGYADDYAYWDDYGYWDDEAWEYDYPDWDDYGYRNDDYGYGYRDNYGYRDDDYGYGYSYDYGYPGADNYDYRYGSADSNGYSGADRYGYWEREYEEYPDTETYEYRERSGDDRQRPAPPEGRPGRRIRSQSSSDTAIG